jgi:hypothetical protein
VICSQIAICFFQIRESSTIFATFWKKIAISASIPFRHSPDLDESLNILDEKFVATPATKIEASLPIWLQPKYEKKALFSEHPHPCPQNLTR